MKLVSPLFSTPLCFTEGEILSLVIENQTCFRRFLSDLYSQAEGLDGNAILSRNNKPVVISKSVEILDEYINFDMNRKPLLSKISSFLESEAVNATNYERTQFLLSEWERYIYDLSFSLPCNVSCSKLSISSLLKAGGLSVTLDTKDVLESIIQYMNTIRDLDTEKLYVFINLRSYYSDEKMNAFCETASFHKHTILLVESVARPSLKREKRLTIDKDWCEI